MIFLPQSAGRYLPTEHAIRMLLSNEERFSDKFIRLIMFLFRYHGRKTIKLWIINTRVNLYLRRESMSVYLDLKRNGIVAVLRHARIQTIVPIAQTLKEAGVTVLEVTMETPMALRIIEKLCTEFADNLTIGAGTVLDAETARAAILAGAQFVVSPTVNIETIRTVKRYGVLCMPGAMTPSEILTAYEFGADIVKVFPANVLGPAYIKAISGPFPHIPLLATGGINLENVEDYIKAGVVAVGLGNSLLDPSKEMTNEELIRLKETARRFVEKVRNAKQWLIDRKLG